MTKKRVEYPGESATLPELVVYFYNVLRQQLDPEVALILTRDWLQQQQISSRELEKFKLTLRQNFIMMPGMGKEKIN